MRGGSLPLRPGEQTVEERRRRASVYRTWDNSAPSAADMAKLPAPPAPSSGPLARETELLSRTLARVLAEQRGAEFSERVTWLHVTAAELRAGDLAAGEALVEYLRALPDEEVEPHIRACALQLQLANIAEERERIRR